MIAQVGVILRPMSSLYLFTGPVLVLALYFQAIGNPAHTAALTLIKPFVFSPLLIAILGIFYGAQAIWLAFPIADGIVVSIAIWIVSASKRTGKDNIGFGLSGQEQAR